MVKKIAGIPAYVIDGHQEAYHLWRELGFQDKSLVHVDAHSDMGEEVEKFGDGTYNPRCGNYLLPSIRQNIVNDIWWVNPFSVSKYCLHLLEKGKRPQFRMKQWRDKKRAFWEDENYARKVLIGEGLQNYEVPKLENRKYILDIDLDAFSCWNSLPLVEFPKRSLSGKSYYASAEEDYSQRISRVLETLVNLGKPEMIVIAKSQERKKGDTFIRPSYVRPVKRELIKGLETIFS